MDFLDLCVELEEIEDLVADRDDGITFHQVRDDGGVRVLRGRLRR